MIEAIMNSIQAISTIVILIINIALLLYNIIKSVIGKKKNSQLFISENEVDKSEVVENVVDIIKRIIPQAIIQAEKSGIKGSENKKLLALSQILLSCNAENFDYKANAELIDECLEDLIEFSKVVNAKKESDENDKSSNTIINV